MVLLDVFVDDVFLIKSHTAALYLHFIHYYLVNPLKKILEVI